ncbi:hypothetical protein [Candidatus Magnetobacterium casense]|uniref:hypothetical protein n=1 Tax=Candidatus Magnetobacterium casense TaxID=1455061 RepID=UPI0012DC22FC|nr:hypothetical protein [Candidatus Magnetobacterium casensis]
MFVKWSWENFFRSVFSAIDEFVKDIPYDETRNYVKRVLKTYFNTPKPPTPITSR